MMSLARARDYFELVKFSHTLFALPFALLGAALAAYAPDSRPAPQDDVNVKSGTLYQATRSVSS